MHWHTVDIKVLRKEYRDSTFCPNRPFKYFSHSLHYLLNEESGDKEVSNKE